MPADDSDHMVIRTAAIDPEHRANLRHLRATFEAAYEAVEDPSDRSSPEYLEADRCYRVWIRAIDDVAMALLDDIDSLEAGESGSGSSTGAIVPRGEDEPPMPDLADVFRGAVEFDRTRELVGTSEIDQEEDRLYEEP